jgi:hypothetical protein
MFFLLLLLLLLLLPLLPVIILQVNAAVDELAGFAEACAKSMASVARNQLARVGAEERIRLQELYNGIAVRLLCSCMRLLLKAMSTWHVARKNALCGEHRGVWLQPHVNIRLQQLCHVIAMRAEVCCDTELWAARRAKPHCRHVCSVSPVNCWLQCNLHWPSAMCSAVQRMEAVKGRCNSG